MREIWIPGLRRVLRVSLSERTVRRDVGDEIAFHLDQRAAELIASGMPEAAARRQALEEYGDVEVSERELAQVDRRRLGHDQREELFMSFIQDVRYAARGLIRRPALLVITTVALSIGIAANSIMFGIVDQLLLRPPAHVAAPDQVKRIYYSSRYDGELSTDPTTTYPVIGTLRERLPGFSEVAAFDRETRQSLGQGENAASVDVELVSGNYFHLLGVPVAMGRPILPEDDRIPLGAQVAVASHGFWQRELGGAAASEVLGHTIVVQGKTYTVVGVAPRGFSGLDRRNVDLWIPISAMAGDMYGEHWHDKTNAWWVQAIGRLAPQVSEEQAEAQATTVYRTLVNSWKESWRDSMSSVVLGSIVGTRAPTGVSDEGKVSLWLMGVSAIVLLIACANVANLLIARTVQRRREISVRLALGVSRGRLMRMLLTEAALLAAIATAVALLLALVASRLVQQQLLPGIVWSNSVLDGRVLGFTLIATVACIVFAGMAPALQGTGVKVSDGLKTGAREVGGHGGRLRFTLMVLQAALSIVLLVGAGLFVHSLRNVTHKDVGIDLDRVLQVSMPLERFGFDSAQVRDIFDRAAARLRGAPGVEAVAITSQTTPMGGATASSFSVPGVEKRPKIPGGGPYNAIAGADFFRTVGASIVLGRSFEPAEERLPSRVAIVNEMLARYYFPDGNAIGQCVKVGGDSVCSEVVGVVENVLMFSLVNDDRAIAYVPPSHPASQGEPPAALLVRAARGTDPDALIPLVRQQVQSLSPRMPFVRVRPYDELVAPQLRPWRLGAAMFTLFGGIALVIAAVGLYSVMAYWVSQRTQEIGVRMALGAKRGDVVRLVAWQSSRAVLLGLVLGGAAALLASRWVAGMLYETSPSEPAVYGLAAVVLACASLLASIIPARRSASVDPALALRSD